MYIKNKCSLGSSMDDISFAISKTDSVTQNNRYCNRTDSVIKNDRYCNKSFLLHYRLILLQYRYYSIGRFLLHYRLLLQYRSFFITVSVDYYTIGFITVSVVTGDDK